MKVLSISTDRNIFLPTSPVRARTLEYGALFDELHVIVFSLKSLGWRTEKISSNVWIYPTNSYSKLLYIFNAIRVGKNIIQTLKFDAGNSVITAQDPFETGKVGVILKKKFGLPFNVQIHTDFLSPYFRRYSFKNIMRVGVAQSILKAADSIRVVSERIRKSIVHDSRFTIQDSRITVLPIWVDVEKIASAHAQFDLHKKYPQFDFIILMVCRLEKEKDIPSALKAFREVLKKYPKAGLIIVGSGGEEGSLKLSTKNYRLETNVVFEPWQKDPVSYYKTADLFLSTSLYEGYGMVSIEAVASGLPVVSSDVGFINFQVLIDGKSTYVCEPNDAACFAQKISLMIENKAMRQTFSFEAMRLLMLQKFSKEKYLESYKKLLADTVTDVHI